MDNSTAVLTMIFYPCFIMSTTAGVFLNCCGQIIELKLLEMDDADTAGTI